MYVNSKNPLALRIGVTAAIALLVIGAYCFIASRPKKAIDAPLVVVGVGLYVSADPETYRYKVSRIFPNSPAEKAGLVTGLILNKVDGIPTATKNIKEVSKLLMGPVGTKVILETINDKGDTNKIEVVREQFINHSVH